MPRSVVRCASTCSVLLAALVLRAAPAPACMTLDFDAGAETRVVDETAAIVWDEARHTEHFIRRATFDSRGKGVGFLVPTPGVPTLAAANEHAFERMARWTLPEQRTQTRWSLKPFWLLKSIQWRRLSNTFNAAAGQLSTTGGDVEVLSTQHVAGYDAVVLSARDASGLGRWLFAHGYPSSRDLRAWLRPYIARGWKITAFKVARPRWKRDAGEALFSSSLVRMSFSTGTPFFPYREPPSQRKKSGRNRGSRSLRVFFLCTRRFGGAIGSARSAARRAWPGRARWSSIVGEAAVKSLAGELALKRSQLPPRVWMTSFEDLSSPRPGFDDVLFSPSPSQSRIAPAPIVTTFESEIPVPVDASLLALALIVYAACARRARRQEEAQADLPRAPRA